MAAGAAVRVRLHTYRDSEVQLADFFHKIKDNLLYHNVKEIEITYEAALTAGTGTAISIADNVMDGTTTLAKVFVDSTSASDTGSITIIGLDNSVPAQLVSEAIVMTGTTGKTSVNTYTRLIHAYLSAGNDAVGTIYVQDDAGGTTKYLTIAAGATESDGCKIYLSNANQFCIHQIDIVPTVLGGISRTIKARAICQGVEGIATGDNDFCDVVSSASTDGPTIHQENHQIWTTTTTEDDGDPNIDFQEGVTTGGSGRLKFHVYIWTTSEKVSS